MNFQKANIKALTTLQSIYYFQGMGEHLNNHHHSMEELTGVEKIRKLFKHKLPQDLDTDFNLCRWIHGWNGKLNEIEPRLKAYIENRKAAKLDHENYLETVEKHPLYHYLRYFSLSEDKSMINSKDNCIFVIQRVENIELHKIPKIITCGDFCLFMFVMCEVYMRHILKHEKLSKKPSGLTILYDMKGINLWEYANLNAPVFKLVKQSLVVLQDFYCDILHKVYLVNAPAVVSVMWELIKRFLNPVTQQKFTIVGSDYKTVLKEFIDVDILPVYYGGNKTDCSGTVNPYTLCPDPKPITNEDYFEPRKFDDWNTVYLKPHACFEIRKIIEIECSKISWQFWTNSELEFTIVKISSKLYISIFLEC